MRPDRQAAAALALRPSAALLAGDSMRSYVTSLPAEARELVSACSWFFANREELAALGGDPDDPDEFRKRWTLEGLVVKRTEQPYSPGERTMVKVKHRRTVDCVVGGYRKQRTG